MLEEQPEVKEAIENNRFEIVLKNVRIDSVTEAANLSQKRVFESMPQLNLLSLTGCSLQNLSSSIKFCSNLISLVLPSNDLRQLPDIFDSFPKLKFVDLSHNSLDSLPSSLSTCETLESLILNNNVLTQSSFPDLSNLLNLHVFDASHNNLSRIPSSLTSPNLSAKLHTITLTHNAIEEIPNSLSNLKQLKDFKIDENKLREVPTVLAFLPKLKVLDISQNTFSESRFLKLANDKRAKLNAIIALAKKLGKPMENEKEENDTCADEKAETEESEKRNSLVVRTGIENLTVRRHPSVAEIRPFLVCCVFNNVDLNGDSFKKFIALQTKMHASSLCENRTLSAIGTHRLDSFQLPLCYMALPKEDLYIRALNKKSSVSASELLDSLLRDAELARKRSKRSTVDPLHKYLHIVKDEQVLACLVDSQQIVISLPPITNSDCTKLTVDTTSIWVEVSSRQSLEACKKTMDELVVASALLFPDLSIDQVRVVDNETLVSVYPDKNDLAGMSVDRRRNRLGMTETSGVSIASSTIVCAEAEIKGEVTIKEGCVVHPHVIFDATKGPIFVGDNNIFEEYSVICNNSDGQPMIIGDSNIFQVHSKCSAKYVGSRNVIGVHAVLEDGCSVPDDCSVAPKSHVFSRQNLDPSVAVHGQFGEHRQTVTPNLTPNTQLEFLRKVIPSYHHLYGKKRATAANQ
ncbi:unnamed protein product [Caenorhabditis sp. 36 PRJEB53466]|nr:unnamed protein product [Caenorhabditis sp. 36 PRJEB53466]